MSGTYLIWPPSSSGSGSIGVSSIGSMDAQAQSVNGASVSGSSLFMQSASSSSGGAGVGLINTVDQPFLGVKTFVSSPILASQAAITPLFTTNTGQITNGSVSLTAQVSGLLPQANLTAVPIQPGGNTTGSISLTSQVVGNLPLTQTSGSISLTTQVSGVLPQANVASTSLVLGINTFGSLSSSQVSVSGLSPNAQLSTNGAGQVVVNSVSLTAQVTGVLPLANTSVIPLNGAQVSGSISLTAQVSGILPNANMSAVALGTASQVTGSVSLTNQVVGNLPLSQTSGSISLTTQVSGVLPIANGGGAPNFTAQTSLYNAVIGDIISCSSASFTIVLPTASGSSNLGKSVSVRHNGLSLSQIYTIFTTSSQTISRGGTTVSSFPFYTVGEVAQFTADNTGNWQILNHDAVTTMSSFSSVLSGCGTVSSAYFGFSRNQNLINISGAWVNGTVGGAGVIGALTLPSLLTPSVTGNLTFGLIAGNSHNPAGYILASNGSNSLFFSSTTSGVLTPVSNVGSQLISTGELIIVQINDLPITQWQP